MKTRTLILWSLMCGAIILVAGSIKLFQVSTDDTKVEFLPFGQSAAVADIQVSAESFVVDAQHTYVTVTMAGPVGTDAREGWRIVVGDRVLSPVNGPSDMSDECTTMTATPVTCVVVFPPADNSLVVAYLRAGDQRQWSAQS